MQSLISHSKNSAIKYLSNNGIRRLFLQHNRSFGLAQMEEVQEKILEISDPEQLQEDDDEIETEEEERSNSLIESIVEADMLETAQSSQHKLGSVEYRHWQRQHRRVKGVDDSHKFANIINAKSVQEIRSELDVFKQKMKKNHTNQIMDLLDSISGSNEETAANEVRQTPQQRSKESKMHRRTVSEAYCKAIEFCGYLKEYQEGFKIFEEAKQERKFLNADIFGSAIALTMNEDFSPQSLNKCFKLKHEMEDTYKIKASAKVYRELIDNALALHSMKTAGGLVQKILKMEKSEKERLLRDRICGKFLRLTIMNYFATSKQIQRCVQFIAYLLDEIGPKAVDPGLFSTTLSGIAQCVEDGDHDMLGVAEKLFRQSFEILDGKVDGKVFSAMLNVYGSIPDVESCSDMLKGMIENPEWPNPNAVTFAACLKAIQKQGRQQPFEYEQGWNGVQAIMDLMQEQGVKSEAPIYSLLFNFCSGGFCGKPDIEKLYRYYDEMEEKKVRLNPQAAQNLILAGLDFYIYQCQNSDVEERETIQAECKKFVDWALLQYKRHNIPFIAFHQQHVESKLQQIML